MIKSLQVLNFIRAYFTVIPYIGTCFMAEVHYLVEMTCLISKLDGGYHIHNPSCSNWAAHIWLKNLGVWRLTDEYHFQTRLFFISLTTVKVCSIVTSNQFLHVHIICFQRIMYAWNVELCAHGQRENTMQMQT